MRRSAVAVVALLSSVVLALAPVTAASAVEPPPPYVDPARALPSQVTKSLFTGAPLIDDQIKVGAWLLAQLKAAPAGAVAAPAATGVPITAAAPLARAGAAGSLLTGAFMGGWMITDGTLAMYGAVTGDEPLGPACNNPAWVTSTLGVLYPFSMPDCQAAITSANSDIVPGTSVTYGGTSIKINSVLSFPNRNVGWEYCISAAPPAGIALVLKNNAGTWVEHGVGTYFGSTSCRGVAGGAGSPYNFVNQPGTLGLSTSYDSPPFMGLRQSSSGAIVAQQQSANTNPTRQTNCRLGWPGGTFTTGTGPSYQESNGFPIGGFDAACTDALVSKPGGGPDLLPSTIEIGSTNTDDGAYTEISTTEVPDFTESERKGLTPGTSGGLVLQKVVGTTVDSCMTWAADCAGWWEATEQGTTTSTSTGEYRCLYNGSAVDLVECGIYRHTFDTKTSTPTITDPTTGLESPWTSTPNPSNSLSPGTGPGLDPGGECFSNGWASVANPLEWVLLPVKCALVWAFVPRADVVSASQARVQESVDETIVGTTATALAGLGAAFDAGVGCGGLPFHIEGPGWEVNEMLLASCEEPAAGIAATVRTILTVVIIIGGILAFTRYLGSLFGFQSFGRNNSERSSSGGVSFD